MYTFAAAGLGADRIGTGPVCPAGQTCYELCIFTSGPRVEAIQQSLAKSGADISQAQPGVFDDATCAAWQQVFGRAPEAADLIHAGTNPNETCYNAAVPGCPGLKRSSAGLRLTGGQWGLVGAAAGILALAGYHVGRRRR